MRRLTALAVVAPLVLSGCAAVQPAVDVAQIEKALVNAEAAAGIGCPGSEAQRRIGIEAGTARSALRHGLPPIDPMNALNEKLIECAKMKSDGTAFVAAPAAAPRPVADPKPQTRPSPQACTQAALDVLDANREQDAVDPRGTAIMRKAMLAEDRACAY